ncbi:Lrp/AsnC ligand binding domain-containing protein [[Eubacterium] cellulosolvens]
MKNNIFTFILINSETGAENELLQELNKRDSVVGANSVYGVYSIIVKMVSEKEEKLKELLNLKIRKLKKVRSTVSMILAPTLSV